MSNRSLLEPGQSHHRRTRLGAGLAAVASMAAVLVLGPGSAGSASAVNYPAATLMTYTGSSGDGRFIVRCEHSHFASDDPIVSPGVPGAAHQHEFFGAATTDAFSTVGSLVAGSNTCDLSDDDSAYWFPAMTDGGVQVTATNVRVYYLDRIDGPVGLFPEGFRLIAGSSTSTGPQSVVSYDCGDGANVRDQDTVPNCPGGTMRVSLTFPECSDGRNDSLDHKAHMAYAFRGACPTTHPIPLPSMLAEVSYPSNGGSDVSYSSGGWASFHGDFMNAWNPPVQAELVTNCLNIEGRSCGLVRDVPNRPRNGA